MSQCDHPHLTTLTELIHLFRSLPVYWIVLCFDALKSCVNAHSNIVGQVEAQRSNHPIIESLTTRLRLNMLEQTRELRHFRIASRAEVRTDLAMVVLKITVDEVLFVLAEDELVRPVPLCCQSVEPAAIYFAAAARFKMNDLLASVKKSRCWDGRDVPCRRRF